MKKSRTAPVKDIYKVTNWQQYNRNLCERGRIRLWIEDSVVGQWRDIDVKNKVVGEALYPDSVIQPAMMKMMPRKVIRCYKAKQINYGVLEGWRI